LIAKLIGRVMQAAGALAIAVTPSLAQQAAPQGMKEVGVITLALEDVPRIYTLPGRTIASEQAVIIPRVNGLIQEMLYTPGRPIQSGDPMFRIGAEVYEAAVMQAEADVASANAGVTQAQATFERSRQLAGSGVSQADFEAAEAALEQAQATLQSSEAQLRLAQTELSWTTVTSPIDGMTSVPSMTVGALVSSTQTDGLAVVTRLDPIEVDMYEPSGRIQAIRDDIETGRLRVNESIRATLTLDNGTTYAAAGEFVAPGYTVSTTTGTIDVRFRFENPDFRIYPGMFVRGQVELGTTEALLLPQSAATRGRDGQLMAWVAEDGKAVQRPVTEDGTHENSWIVTKGLSDGDQVIVDGFAGLTAGMPLSPVAVTFDETGVIRDVPSAAADTE